MEYIRSLSKPKDGNILAIGHSMGGILLYAMLSKYCKKSYHANLVLVMDIGNLDLVNVKVLTTLLSDIPSS